MEILGFWVANDRVFQGDSGRKSPLRQEYVK